MLCIGSWAKNLWINEYVSVKDLLIGLGKPTHTYRTSLMKRLPPFLELISILLHILRKDQGNQNISESILSSDHHISSITQISLKKPTQIGKRLFYQRNKKDCFIPFRK